MCWKCVLSVRDHGLMIKLGLHQQLWLSFLTRVQVVVVSLIVIRKFDGPLLCFIWFFFFSTNLCSNTQFGRSAFPPNSLCGHDKRVSGFYWVGCSCFCGDLILTSFHHCWAVVCSTGPCSSLIQVHVSTTIKLRPFLGHSAFREW